MAIGIDDGTEVPPGVPTKTFAYSAANRMASVSENGELLMSYRYNGAGERVYRSGSGQTAHTVFDANGQWLGDYDEYGQVIQQAIWLGDLPVGLLARLDGGERRVFYIQPDALGTPRVVIDPSRGLPSEKGVAVWRWELEDEAFGETEPNQDPDDDNTLFVLDMRYPGQQHDSATGFNYNYFRDYDPSTGRYVQSDPIGLDGGISSYSYAYGNSQRYADPFGLRPGDCYRTQDIAAANALMDINPRSISIGKEFAGWIYRTKNGWYTYTAPNIGDADSSYPGPKPDRAVARYHTHGAPIPNWNADRFSDRDLSNAREHQVDSYVGTPSGFFLKYDRLNNDARVRIARPSANNADKCDCSSARVPTTFKEKMFDFIFGDF